jgi:hypothetical protein
MFTVFEYWMNLIHYVRQTMLIHMLINLSEKVSIYAKERFRYSKRCLMAFLYDFFILRCILK